MPTLLLRVEGYMVRHQSSLIASDWRDGASIRRFRGFEPRWVRIWTIQGAAHSRGDVQFLLQQMRAGGIGTAEWDWTPPRELSAIKVQTFGKLDVDLVNAATNRIDGLQLVECLTPDT